MWGLRVGFPLRVHFNHMKNSFILTDEMLSELKQIKELSTSVDEESLKLAVTLFQTSQFYIRNKHIKNAYYYLQEFILVNEILVHIHIYKNEFYELLSDLIIGDCYSFFIPIKIKRIK